MQPALKPHTKPHIIGHHPRMRVGQAIAVYVWQYPLRLVHWGLVISIGVLSFNCVAIRLVFILITRPA